MCSVEDKEELEALKSWKQEVALVLETLQAQVSTLSSEVKLLKQGLDLKDEEIKLLKRVFGPELSPRQQRRARSLIALGNVPTMTWSEADKPKATGLKRSSSHSIRISNDPLNIGQHKTHPHELGITVPDINGTSTYKQALSPHASSLQLSSLQTFASSDGASSNSTQLPPLELEVTESALPESSEPSLLAPDSQIQNSHEISTDSANTSEESLPSEIPPQDQKTPVFEQIIETIDQTPEPAAAIPPVSQSTDDSASDSAIGVPQTTSEQVADQSADNNQTTTDPTNTNEDQTTTEQSPSIEQALGTTAELINDTASQITQHDSTNTEQVTLQADEQINHVLRVITADESSSESNGHVHTVPESSETPEPEFPSSKLHIPSTAITESTISESTELVIGIEIPHEGEEEYSSAQAQDLGFRLSGEHVITPQVAKRELKPKSFTITKGLLSIEIPNVVFGSPRSFTPSTPTLMSSPHLPTAPPPTPVNAPETLSLTPTNTPPTPKLHLTRPKLQLMADELKAKGSTLKRTTTPSLNRSDSLREVWLPPLDIPAPTTPTTPPADIGELYAPFSANASDAESEPESPHSARLKTSASEERITSPESSDTEDSFIKIKEKYATQKFEPDTLRRYEQDAKRVVLAQKVMRGWIHRKRLEKIRKRTEATKELLSTELGYAKCLDLMIHHYVKPLRSNSTSPHAYILPSQVDEIFSTVEDIKQSSAMMLMELDALMKSWNYFSCVGPVMLSHIEMLQPHMPFVVNYEKAQQVLATCSKNKEFSAFLRRRMSSSELDYKTLDDFLILPVQRIPRYIMLLEAIYKYTPASHPDRDDVRKAAHQMRLLAEKINKRKAAVVKLAEFCACLKGYEGEEIMTESRYLVREGNLLSEKRRPRYAALLNDLLIVCKPPKPQKASKKESQEALKKPSYKFVQLLKLESTTSLQVRPCGAATSTGATPYLIILKNANATVTIMTGAEDGKGWTKDVHNVLEAIRKKK
eukprot:Phypoly_transcript_01607.p1 GENE.Phypoly_transcript_01607~~Phypoly_transcript_01607.p1  ORF type:complete len:989 (+),score=174.08 Phypoly_transcript_01607:163-3129(+)